MDDRLKLKLDRIKQKKAGSYFEGHHIIPRSKGGSGNSNRPKNNPNIVLLTAREHFLAHWLLWRIYRDRSSSLAFHKMLSSNNNQTRSYSSRAYEEARQSFSETNKGNQYGKGQTKIISEEQKKKQSSIMKGRYVGEKNPFYGKTHSEETKSKIRQSRIGMVKEKAWNYRGKKIVLRDGVVIGEFDNTKDVAKFIGKSDSVVRAVLSGNQKSTMGYEIKHFQEYYALLK